MAENQICLSLALLYFFDGQGLLHLFLDHPSEGAMKAGVQFLRILAPFYFIISEKLVADGVLRGSALMKKFMAATFTDLILRVLLAFLLARTALASAGIWKAWPIGWSVVCFLSLYFYRHSHWQERC